MRLSAPGVGRQNRATVQVSKILNKSWLSQKGLADPTHLSERNKRRTSGHVLRLGARMYAPLRVRVGDGLLHLLQLAASGAAQSWRFGTELNFGGRRRTGAREGGRTSGVSREGRARARDPVWDRCQSRCLVVAPSRRRSATKQSTCLKRKRGLCARMCAPLRSPDAIVWCEAVLILGTSLYTTRTQNSV